MEELFAIMETWPDVALERVQKAEKWVAGAYWDVGGARCLVGHAADYSCEVDHRDNTMPLTIWYPDLFSSSARSRATTKCFDNVARMHGADVVGRECSARAAEILAARRAQKAEVADAVSVG